METKGQLFLNDMKNSCLLGDGAIGTVLFARGAEPDKGVERLNLTSPDIVLQLHRDYIEAGSRVIETNTFGASRPNLERYGVTEDCRTIIRAGVKLAKEAAGSDIYVAGSVGPLPPFEGAPLSKSEQVSAFSEQVRALVDSGVDIIILETFIDLDQLIIALDTVRSITDMPVISQMAFEAGGRTAGGDMAEVFARRCLDSGADVIGANCGGGVVDVFDAVSHIAPFNVSMSAYMNAGFAENLEGRRMYLAPVEYLSRKAVELAGLGVRLIGGCCGTGPETIHAMSRVLSCIGKANAPVNTIAREARIIPQTPPEATVNMIAELIPYTPRSIFVELDPPRDLDIGPLITGARKLKDTGIAGITLADNPLASVRVDVLAAAGIVKSETGLNIIPHLTGRDRNRIALQSTILGAHLLGIRSILCVTGDPVRMYNETNTSGVFDVTSVGMVKLVSQFNSGKRLNDTDRTMFSIGVAFNPNVSNINSQVAKLQRKIEAGAHFALSQPIFDVERLDVMQKALEAPGITLPVYVGVMPLMSARSANFLHYEVPGITIPEAIRERLSSYENIDDQTAAGIEVMQELITNIGPRVHGYYLMAPLNLAEMVIPLIDTIHEVSALD